MEKGGSRYPFLPQGGILVALYTLLSILFAGASFMLYRGGLRKPGIACGVVSVGFLFLVAR